MKGRSLFAQFFITYLIMIFVSIGLVSFLSLRIVRRVLFEEALSRQSHYTRTVANLLPPGTEKDSEALQKYCEQARNQVAVRITIIRGDGTVLADTDHDPQLMNDHSDRLEIKLAAKKGSGSAVRYSSTLSEDLLYTAVYLQEYDLFVRIASSVSNVRQVIVSISSNILMIGIAALLLSGIISFISGKRLSRFLDSVVKTASSYARGDFSERIHGNLGTMEVRRLAESLNAMALQLREKISTISYQKSELKSMLDNMTEPVILLDHKLLIKDMNPAALSLVSLSFRECVGRSIIRIVRNIELCNLAENVLETQRSEEKLIHFDERPGTFLQARINLLKDDQNEVVGVLVVLNDVSAMKRLDNMRKDFVANVSHELKTPITSILGYIETLQSGLVKDSGKRDEFYTIIRNQGERLSSIVTELLTLSRLEEGEYGNLDKEQVPVTYLCSSAVSNCSTLAVEKGIHIKCYCGDENTTLNVHPLFVEQTLINLLNNAVKYSDPGKVITIRLEKEGEYSVMSVKDQGWGIPLQDQERIFERFYRVDKARSRELGGTGLGLAIVKHTMLAHGGHVELISQSGEGSSFKLYFPDATPDS